jgi:hypothetical protein
MGVWQAGEKYHSCGLSGETGLYGLYGIAHGFYANMEKAGLQDFLDFPAGLSQL